ncbi:MAG: hypothetical protein B7Z22_06630, partial [Hyphomonas sp. 32-62-5]
RIASVLEYMAISPQFPAFLPGTLADQLRLAAPAATEEEMWTALRLACAEEFVRCKEDGLSIRFEEGNLPFSGGELRRIGLARALLVSPEILVVDEPFAGLEPALARRLAGNLAQWAQAAPRALVMLAHKQTDLPFEGLARQSIRIG